MNARSPLRALCVLALFAGGARADSTASAVASAAATETAPPAHSRDFPAPDLAHAQRVAIATLQDLGFALESADAERGLLIASLLDTHPLRLAVSITAKDESTINATITADYAGSPIADPNPATTFLDAYAAALNPLPEIDF